MRVCRCRLYKSVSPRLVYSTDTQIIVHCTRNHVNNCLTVSTTSVSSKHNKACLPYGWRNKTTKLLSKFNGFLTVHHSIELKFTTNLMHDFYLFNNNIISWSSTCFEHHMLIFRRTLYICCIWYPHALYAVIRCTESERTAGQSARNRCTVWQHTEREDTRYSKYTMSSWRWACDARNM
jgi:hypothetical protein